MDPGATSGHLEIALWLHEHRVEATMDGAATYGHLNVIKWLHENTDIGCTTEVFIQRQFLVNSPGILKWLNGNWSEGCTCEAMHQASESGILSKLIVKWLHADRAEKCTQKAMSNAVEGGSFVKWLLLHCHDCSTAEAIEDTMTSNKFEICFYLPDEFHVKCIRANLDVDGNGELHEWILEHYPEFQATVDEDDMF